MNQIRGSYIAGRWITGASIVERYSPSDLDRCVGRYYRAEPESIQEAVRAAREASGAWGASSPQERAAALERIADGVASVSEEFAQTLALEEGKRLVEARGEVERAVAIFRYFSGEALRNWGEFGPSTRAGVDVEVRREPVGVVGLITPWNFPIAIPAWKTAPALAFGNTVILKPADAAPGCARLLAQAIERARIPAGVFNLILGKGRDVGAAFTGADGCDAISFTGSVAVGQELAVLAAKSQRRLQLEMGGKNPLVILEDASLPRAVDVAVQSAFFQTGQRCTAASRIIVVDAIHDAFVEALTARMRLLRVGHALASETKIGPVATEDQFTTDESYLKLAREEGAQVVGGERLDCTPRGLYLRPALLLGTHNAMRVNREEIFGPIAAVIRVRDAEEALHTSNDSEFGLSAGVCTDSLALASEFRRRMRAGMVMVNLPTAGVDHHVPFGGAKASSYGPREQGPYAREFYTSVKTAYIAY